MKVADLDHHASGNKPLTNCLRWLRSCLASCVSWQPDQRMAAEQAVTQAEEVLALELSPNLSERDLAALLTPIKHDTSPLRKVLEENRLPTRDELLALNLWEGSLIAKLEATEAVLGGLTVRIAFIDWPAEAHWNAGTEERPHWVPDWREEIALIEAARHGVPFRVPDPRPILPWNRIPEEDRPRSQNQGVKRLHKLHLAWLDYREQRTYDGQGNENLSALLKLKDDMREAFEKRVPAPNPQFRRAA